MRLGILGSESGCNASFGIEMIFKSDQITHRCYCPGSVFEPIFLGLIVSRLIGFA